MSLTKLPTCYAGFSQSFKVIQWTPVAAPFALEFGSILSLIG